VAPEAQLAWEARAGRPAAAAAFAAALLTLLAGVYLPLALSERPDGADEFLIAADREGTDFIVSGAIQGLGTLLVAVVLAYLYRVTRYRRKQLLPAALVLAIAGAVLAAVLSVAVQVDRVNIAHDFVERPPATPSQQELLGITNPGEYLDKVNEFDPEDRAEQYIEDETSPVLSGVGFGANLALGFAFVLIALNAMRAGLLSRFTGILGVIIGALYVLPLLGGPQIIQLFWLGALGALFLGRWPGGRGPAWDTGEEAPWPTAAQQRERIEREREAAGYDEDGSERADPDAEADARDEPAPTRAERSRSARRKRKRKRR